MKLVELNEGARKELVSGELENLVTWLQKNPEECNWVLDEDPDMEIPDLSNIETLQELEFELKKIDLSWWTLVIE